MGTVSRSACPERPVLIWWQYRAWTRRAELASSRLSGGADAVPAAPPQRGGAANQTCGQIRQREGFWLSVHKPCSEHQALRSSRTVRRHPAHTGHTAPRAPVLVTLPASNIAVPVDHSCAKTGDCDDNPYHEHRGDHALIAVLGDYGYQPGDPGTDPDTQQQGLVPTWGEHLSN
jgi:hypothetical protein